MKITTTDVRDEHANEIDWKTQRKADRAAAALTRRRQAVADAAYASGSRR